jgi:hypothetical protein
MVTFAVAPMMTGIPFQAFRKLGLTAALIMILSHMTLASPLSLEIDKSLSNRDRALQNVSFEWQRHYILDLAASPKSIYASSERQAEQNAQYKADKAGLTDPKERADYIADWIKSEMSGFYGVRIETDAPWHFRRSGDTISALGQMDGPDNFKVTYDQTYSDGWGAIINTGSNHPLRHNVPPQIWGAAGNAAYVNCPFQSELNIQPEHFAVLMGLNPLKMYGVKWDLLTSDDALIRLRASVESSNDSPAVVDLTLDPKHGYAPAEIDFRSVNRPMTVTFKALSYRKFCGEWICDKASYEMKLAEFLTKKATWELQTVGPSTKYASAIKDGETVMDYRLLGDQPKQADVLKAVMPGGSQPEYYSWPGHLPTLAELRTMHGSTEERGPVSPTTLVMLITGIALIIGAVWWRMRRR